MNKRTKIEELLAASGDRPTNFYDRAPQHEGFIAEKDVSVPMRDGVNLSVDVYRPKENGKYPALLAFSIYNKDLQGPDAAEHCRHNPRGRPSGRFRLKPAIQGSSYRGVTSTSSVRRGKSSSLMAAVLGNGTVTISSNGSPRSRGVTATWVWSEFPASAPSSFMPPDKIRRT